MFSESGIINAVKNSYPSYNTRFDFFKVCQQDKQYMHSRSTNLHRQYSAEYSAGVRFKFYRDSLSCFQCVKLLGKQRCLIITAVCFLIEMFIKIKPQSLSLQNVENSIRDVKSTGQNPRFQSAVGPAGEEPIALGDVDVHDSRPEVSEYGLFSMFIFK